MTYNEDFYQNKPALTVNSFKEGHAYYIATRFEDDFYDEFYTQLLKETKIHRPLDIPLPEGVIVTDRDGYLFFQNFNRHEVTLSALPTTIILSMVIKIFIMILSLNHLKSSSFTNNCYDVKLKSLLT